MPSEVDRLEGTVRHLRLVPPHDRSMAPGDRRGTPPAGCVEPSSVWVLSGVQRTTPGRTRQLVRQWCAAWDLPDDVAEHTVLTANELVTRAVRRSAPRVVVSLALEDTDVLVEVSDPLGGRRPRRVHWFGRPSLEEHCGLRLVDGVARSWGVSSAGRPDRSWARVPRA